MPTSVTSVPATSTTLAPAPQPLQTSVVEQDALVDLAVGKDHGLDSEALIAESHPDFKGHVEMLLRGTRSEKMDVLEHLAKYEDRNVTSTFPALERTILFEETHVRIKAIRAVERIVNSNPGMFELENVRQMVGLMRTLALEPAEDQDVRGVAAECYSSLGYCPDVALYRDLLADRNGKSDAYLRGVVAGAGNLNEGYEEILPELLKLLAFNVNSEVQLAVINGLKKQSAWHELKGRHDVVKPLIDFIHDKRVPVVMRRRAASALAMTGDSSALPVLVEDLHDKDLEYHACQDMEDAAENVGQGIMGIPTRLLIKAYVAAHKRNWSWLEQLCLKALIPADLADERDQ